MRYIENVLDRFNMHSCKHVSTLWASHFRLSTSLCLQLEDEIEYIPQFSCTIAISTIMYATVCIRPYLSFIISSTRRYMTNRGKEYWKVVQWILHYLCGSSSMCLILRDIEMGLLVLWVQILLEILIKGDHWLNIYWVLVVVQLLRRQHCKSQLCIHYWG